MGNIAFVDFEGNPLPPGTTFTIYPLGVAQTPANVVASGMVSFGGQAYATLSAGEFYIISLVGALVRAQDGTYPTQTFTAPADGSTPIVTVATVVSVFRTLENYFQFARRRLYPKNWLLLNQSPKADATLRTLLTPIADIDAQIQLLLSAQRLPSCVGPDVDSWAADMFGSFGVRIQNESDVFYFARLQVLCSRERMTLNIIQLYVTAYLNSISSLPYFTQTSALDEAGGLDTSAALDSIAPDPVAQSENTLAADTQGGLDDGASPLDATAPPATQAKIIVFDMQSDPMRSAQLGFVIGDCKIGIELSFDGYAETLTATQPIAQDVDRVIKACLKASGTQLVWCTNRASS